MNARAMIACVVAATLACGAANARGDAFALTGATVHTVSGATLPNATVVVEDGRIRAVGVSAAIPAGARRIDCAGKHVYPGVISPNTVLGLVEIASVAGTRDEAETGDVNPNIRAEVEINPESEHIPVARINGVTSALVIPRGGVITGTSALIHLDGWTYEDMTVRAPVGLHVRWPNMTNVPRSYAERRSDEQQKKDRERALDAVRQAFDDARAYWKARDAEGAKGIPRHDQDVKWNAMRLALRGEIPVMFHASRLNQIEAVLDFMDEQALKNVVLVDADDAWRIADELKRRNIAVICDRIFEQPSRSWQPYDETFTLPAKLQAAGVRYCISDGAGSGADPHNPMNVRNLPYEAGMAAAFGLTHDQAVRAITLSAAEILGVGDRLGSIDAGKIADLVVTDGDLLEITTQVEQVYIAGRAIPMTSRQTRLFEKYDARPRGTHARPREGENTR